ncbi:hypothetical protein LWI28_004559 [Acer negundo]|uniref:Uncharacterized protein n=1 Tax=Acer negundo TaxID=4023 RepID=A0AAD5NJJ7_ACENE|nr:hypothetical protein LWI28_004559 [Acer negundo]
MKEPPVDIGINQWFSLYPSRGLTRPIGPKKVRAEAEDSELEAEGSESKAEGSEPEADAHATRKEEIRAIKEEILREIAALEGRTMAVISDVEDGLMQDFAKFRTELKVSLYIRQKKVHSISLGHSYQTGGSVISKESAQMRITMERSLKEMADREAAASDPSGKGKGKLQGTS